MWAGAPKPKAVREAVSSSMTENVKLYNMTAFCERPGLARRLRMRISS